MGILLNLGATLGVTISVDAGYGLDMREIDFNALLYADSYYRGSTVFTADYGLWADQFRGGGFKYNSDGKPIGGTVTSYFMLYGMTEMVGISGISIAASKIANAAETSSLSDDIAVIRDALAGNDRLEGGLYNNYLRGYAGNDVISGGRYEDDLFGDDGDDRISGGDSSDNLHGGDGNDTLNGGSGIADNLSGGAGSDTASYQAGLVGVVASLSNAANNTYDANGDRYSSIENLTGTSYADTLEGNASVNILIGGNGNDKLIGRAGGDILNGGSGTDTVSYEGSTVGVVASLTGSSGNTNDAAGDVYSSIENLIGTVSTDRLFGNDVANTLTGRNGDDSLIGRGGNDVLYGGAGADRLFGGTGADKFVFKTFSESDATTFDSVFDFMTSEQDRIDLSAIDASTLAASNQAFAFLGAAAFSGAAGQLRYVKQASDTYIYGDVNGDKVADLRIHLDDAVTLTKDYFLL